MNNEKAFRKILVPTDFSPTSRAALDQAVIIAKRFQSEIALIHVIEPLAYSVTDTLIVVDHEAALRTTAEALIDNLYKECVEKGLPATKEVVSGTLTGRSSRRPKPTGSI